MQSSSISHAQLKHFACTAQAFRMHSSSKLIYYIGVLDAMGNGVATYKMLNMVKQSARQLKVPSESHPLTSTTKCPRRNMFGTNKLSTRLTSDSCHSSDTDSTVTDGDTPCAPDQTIPVGTEVIIDEMMKQIDAARKVCGYII